MTKFIVAGAFLFVFVVAGSWSVGKYTHDQFVESTGNAMLVDMSTDRLSTIDCNTMSNQECEWMKEMLTKTYTSSYAEAYRNLIKENPDPYAWNKATAVAIQTAYQEAIKTGAGTAPTQRMDAIEAHYSRHNNVQKVSVILALLIVLVFGKLALNQRD